MLVAVKAGRVVLPSRFLSSRRSIRLLRLASCRCILTFTRNPFLLVVMLRCYFIKRRRIHKGFRVFQKTFAPTSFGFACSRPSPRNEVLGGPLRKGWSWSSASHSKNL